METSLVDPANATHYTQEHIKAIKSGADKRYPNVNLVRVVGKYFDSNNGRLLDYGCGFGANLIHLLERGYTIDAVDTSEYALQRITQKLGAYPQIASHANLHKMDANSERLPFAAETFDYIVCASVLSLLSSPDRVQVLLGEFKRILKPGGKLYLDINGPESEFAVFGTPTGHDIYDFRGKSGQAESRMIYCPKTAEQFAELIKPFFIVDEVGFTAHRFFDYAEQEFIVCARKA